jgi:hypothetical protein
VFIVSEKELTDQARDERKKNLDQSSEWLVSHLER